MKLTRDKRQELTSATLTQTLGLMAGCSALLILTAYAADPTAWNDPAWWSAPGPNGLSAVMPEQVITNSITGIVTTNYIADNNAAVTQGQLKKFTVRAVDELNSGLSGGAGSDLSSMVSNWAQDYATNGFNATNPKPADSTAMTVGQLKYIGNKVWLQLVAAGYTNAVPSWLAQNTSTDNALANIGQLKEIFNFSPSVAPPAGPSNLTVTASNPGELDLIWTNNASNATSITIKMSTDGGVTWTNVTTLTDATINSYAVTGLSSGSNYQFQVTANNTAGPSPTTTTTSPPSPPVPRYAVIDFGTNFFPAGINNSNIVVGNAGVVYNGFRHFETPSIWNWASNTNQSLQASSSLVAGTTNYAALGIDDSGHIVGEVVNLPYPLEVGSWAGCYWGNSTQAPSILGQGGQGDPTYEQAHGYPISPSFNGSWVTGISDQGYIVGMGSITQQINWAYAFSPGSMELGLNVGDPLGQSTSGSDVLSYVVGGAAGTSSWCGNCTLLNTNNFPIQYDGTYPVINGTVYMSSAYTNITLDAINDSNIAVGNNGTNAALVYPASGSSLAITNLGPGVGGYYSYYAASYFGMYQSYYLNNALATNGTPTPQVIGYDTNLPPVPMLWDKTTYAGTAYTNAATGNYLGKTLSLLLPGTTNSPWTMTGISGINNGGAIVGTATYSGTNSAIAQGAHGVLLCPANIEIAASPSNDTTYETDGNGYVPIDGGNVNGSAYTMVSGQSTHFPTTPDCNATNLPANDPQLVHLLTQLPTGMGTGWQAQLTVQNNGRARVRFWKDRQKQQEYVVGTPLAFSSFPKDLYVEGTVPGAAQQEINLKLQIIVGGQTSDANTIKLTVTPVLTNYQVYALFNDSPVYSPVYGQPWLFSGSADENDENIDIVATVFQKNAPGRLQHIQTLSIGYPNGHAAALYPGDPATTSPLHTWVWQYAPPNNGQTLVDLLNDANFPYYKPDTSAPQGDTAVVSIEDNPSVSLQTIKPTGSQISVLDMTWSFTDYAVWVYPDGTAYPLGQTTWNVRWSGRLGVVLTNQIIWAADSNNMNNVGQAFQLNNTAPTLNLPSAIDAFNGTGAGFQ